MLRTFSFVLLAALCLAPGTSQAASTSFDYNYFLGMIKPQSWDGPYWWGLRTAVEELVVSKAVTREVRSDRAGYAAIEVSFRVVNTGRSQAGERGLLLHASADPQPQPWQVLSEGDAPWIIGDEVRVAALAPGEATEVSALVYVRADVHGSTAPIAFEISSL
jgi:hypothetical protein